MTLIEHELKNAYIGEYIPLIQNASLLGNTNTKQDVQWVWFSPDWTKMIVWFWNLSYVTEYTLSTPFNPSTKTEIRTLSWTYQNSWIWFNHDGTIMILSTRVNSSFPTYIQKYTLSTPFALNTATLVKSYSVWDKFTAWVCLSDDGKKIYLNIDGEGIYQWTMSTAFDLSTISLSSWVFSSGWRWIALRWNWKILYTSNSNSVWDYGLISQYKLDTPYDILWSKTLLSTFNAWWWEWTALWVSEDMKYFSWCLWWNTSQDVRVFKTK